jgi:hypothetical protein
MSPEIAALLQAVQKALGKGVDLKDLNSTFADGNLMVSRDQAVPLAEIGRSNRGADPRDPNRYWTGPDGNTIGTLMGWPGMGGNDTPTPWLQNLASGMNNTPQAPRSQNGLTRLSPGMYRNEQGQTVRSKTGTIPAAKPSMKDMERAAAKGPARIPKAR